MELKKEGYCFVLGLVMAGIAYGVSTGQAATYYVAKTGSNSNLCSQATAETAAKRTINAGISCLSAGDTLIVKAGTYDETLTNPFSNTGNSWNNKITVKAESTRSVIIRPSNVGSNGSVMYFDSASQKYVEFDGIEIDAVNSPDQGVNIRNDAHHIRFRNGAVLNGQTFGILTVARSGDQNSAAFNEFLNMEVAYTAMNPDGTLRTCRAGEPPGPSYCNGIYIESSNNVFDRVHSHHNNGQGIQLYPSGNRNNIVRNSVLHDNYGNGLVSYDDDHQCINNLIYNNKRWQGLQIGGRNALVYYNTVVNNTDGGIYFWGSGHQAKNNIVYQNDGNDVEGLSLDSTNLVGTNPQFVNAANGDFRLKASSPAIDRGTFLAQVTTAIDGTPRPQGASPDIGAYEFGGSGDTTPPDPPQNARISN